MKKKWLTASSLVAVSALSILGTKAYLTDTDKANNTMVMGDVKIDQIEYGIANSWTNNAGETHAKLGSLEMKNNVLPVTSKVSKVNYKSLQLDNKAVGQDIHLFEMDGVQDKIVFVKNTGNNDVYYRTIIAVECPEGLEEKVRIHANGSNQFDWNHNMDENQLFGNGNETVIYTTINGVRYAMYTVVDTNVLEPEKTSAPSLLQVYLDSTTTNEDVAKLKGKLDVLVATQATQVDTTLGAQGTLNAAFGKISETNHPWENSKQTSTMQENLSSGKDVIMGEDIEGSATINNGSTGKSLLLQDGKKPTIIDGNGNKLIANDANTTNDSVIYTTGGTIKNISISGGFRGIYAGTPEADIILDNVDLDGTYPLNVNSSTNKGHKLIVKHSTLNGWTSYGAAFASAEFTDCIFGKGSTGYAFFRPYMNTTLTNCEFGTGYYNGKEMDYVIDTTKAKVTLKNCTFNGEPITTANLDKVVNNTANVVIE